MVTKRVRRVEGREKENEASEGRGGGVQNDPMGTDIACMPSIFIKTRDLYTLDAADEKRGFALGCTPHY